MRTISLIAGREGIGKSLLAYTLAADISRGRLPGVHEGTPRSVIVAATEDSWSHTIVPRLMAAAADLGRIFRVDVTKDDGDPGALVLPADVAVVETAIGDHEAALLLLDPLISRLAAGLDTHKDAEVRQALEPIALSRTGPPSWWSG